ncbi:MAG TPA: L-fucose isomerase [Fimbriimonadaceae bacterium]|nr:L-fucose isomerase [Fimbriimonadaceae bacterium]
MANAPANRLRGSLPKVGIRPTIDGRYGGVRESLEGFTMAMAKATADLIINNLRHACGWPVECVIADSCIGGVAEAAECADKFAREGVGVSLTVTPCWCYGSETMDMDPVRPKAIWGFNGTDRPGAVYLAATLAGHAQKGLPCFSIYGRDVQDLGDTKIPADVAAKILRFARAGLAVATMRGQSYLAMGGVSMGIAGSIVDQSFFESYLGMRVESIDMAEFVGRMSKGQFDQAEYEKALAWVKQKCREGKDWNAAEKQRTRAQKDEDWETCVKMALIARDLMIGNPRLDEMGLHEQARGHNAIAAGFQGQRQWTDHFPNGDFLEAILCSAFDWNGIRQPFVVATENDSLNGATMLLQHLLTGSAQMFSDVRTYWSPEAVQRVSGRRPTGRAQHGFLHLINSGPSPLDWTGQQRGGDGKPAVKAWWEITEVDSAKCLDNTLWCPSDTGYFPGGGWSTDFTTLGGMPCTMARINLVKGLGPVLQIAEGETVSLPPDMHDVLDERTNPTWPTTWFVPRLTGSGPFRDVYTVMANWGANHGAISFGHIGADLITLASMLRIPVDMHNVAETEVFRPAVWSRFGSLEPQGGDYRACQTYGPLYG